MPKSKSNSRKPKPKTVHRKGFSIETSALEALAKKFDEAPTAPPESLDRYCEILELYGEVFFQEFTLSSSTNELNLSRFTMFGPHDEDRWTVVDQRCALQCLGFTSETAVREELIAWVRKEPGPVVGCYFLTLPRVPTFPFAVFCLLCDKEEQVVLAVLIEDSYVFVPEPAKFLNPMLETIISIGAEALPVESFTVFARDLLTSSKKKLDTYSEEDMAALLKVVARDVGDAMLVGQCQLIDAFRRASNDVIASYRERLVKLGEDSEATLARTVKKMTGQLEKSEMMLKGCQERAQKLEADLAKAKRLAKDAPASAQGKATSLPLALDRLLAATQ